MPPCTALCRPPPGTCDRGAATPPWSSSKARRELRLSGSTGCSARLKRLCALCPCWRTPHPMWPERLSAPTARPASCSMPAYWRWLFLAAKGEAVVPVATRPPILVVDDSLTTRMLEQSILESAGYLVDLAVSGEDALRRLRERHYGLLLVDVEMPGMDGFALIEQLRLDPAWREIPAILVTSRESRHHRQRGLAAGAQGYVIKGEFDQRRLVRRIGELLA